MIDNTALQACPFCGGRASAWDKSRYDTCIRCDDCNSQTGWEPTIAEATAAWNRRAEPANEPLTLAELREVEQTGEGIYVCTLDGDPIFRGKPYTAAVIDKTAAFGTMGYHLQAIYGRGLTLAEGDYGKTWLAYRRKPEPEGGAR